MVDFPETPRSHPDDTMEKLFPTSVLSKILNPSTGAKQLEATVLKTINEATKCIWFVLPATLDAPSAISNASSAISDISFQMPDATSAILNAPFEMQGASFAILDVPFEMQDAPSATQDASFEMQDASFAISNAPSSMAKMASQMPKTSKIAAFAPAAMENGENGVFWLAPALTGKSRPADFQGGRWTILRLHPNGMKIIQPKVAKLPWVIVPINSSTLKGLHRRARIGDATPLGLEFILGREPSVASGNAGLNDSIPLGLAGRGRRSRVRRARAVRFPATHKRHAGVWP